MFILTDPEGNKLIEYAMYSERFGYAGTPDLVAMDSKETVIIFDWKTSTTEQVHWDYQLAAYEQLVKEVFSIKKKIIRKTVRFEENSYHVRTRAGITCMADWTAFQSCANVYKISA